MSKIKFTRLLKKSEMWNRNPNFRLRYRFQLHHLKDLGPTRVQIIQNWLGSRSRCAVLVDFWLDSDYNPSWNTCSILHISEYTYYANYCFAVTRLFHWQPVPSQMKMLKSVLFLRCLPFFTNFYSPRLVNHGNNTMIGLVGCDAHIKKILYVLCKNKLKAMIGRKEFCKTK